MNTIETTTACAGIYLLEVSGIVPVGLAICTCAVEC